MWMALWILRCFSLEMRLLYTSKLDFNGLLLMVLAQYCMGTAETHIHNAVKLPNQFIANANKD